MTTLPTDIKISTHTPHARRDMLFSLSGMRVARFQLTRLMRGVTNSTTVENSRAAISTHTPHARRDLNPQRDEICPNFISTHTPHARRDLWQ